MSLSHQQHHPPKVYISLYMTIQCQIFSFTLLSNTETKNIAWIIIRILWLFLHCTFKSFWLHFPLQYFLNIISNFKRSLFLFLKAQNDAQASTLYSCFKNRGHMFFPPRSRVDISETFEKTNKLKFDQILTV